MKRLLLIFIFLFSNITHIYAAGTPASSNAPAKMEYRRATEADVGHILELIDLFDEADDRQLAIPPETAREAWLLEEIQKNHFFVACDLTEEDDDGVNPIVGFCKIYIVEPDDIFNIVSNELGAILPNRFDFVMKEPHCNDVYKITEDQADNFATKLSPLPLGVAPLCQVQPHDIYIYLGTNYTRLSHRGRGINTQLEQAVFKIIRPEVIAKLEPESSIYYIFGVVEENWGKQTRLRSFAKFARSLLPRIRSTVPIYIFFTAFSSVKPTLIIDNRASQGGHSPRVVMSPRVPGAVDGNGIPGFGCFLKFDIPPRYHADLGIHDSAA